jgi:hypothetical protein
METSSKQCKGACGEEKSIDDYEITLRNKKGGIRSRRAVCKVCYQKAKSAKAKEKSSQIDRNDVPKPVACNGCGLGVPNVDFKWRDDVSSGGWRNECNSCFNAKGYSEKSRAARRGKDEQAYLKHNAEVHLAWAHRNTEKVNAQLRMAKTNPERRWKALCTYVRGKYNDDWESHICMADKDALILRLSDGCNYCNHKPVGDGNDDLNGLDRVDSSGIYSLANTVPCCGVCNAMKLTFSTDEFIWNVRKIIDKWILDKTSDDIIKMSSVARLRPLGKDKKRMENGKKDKTCKLTDDERIHLLASECYLCGRAPALGIDRVDANKGYVTENCKPCCTQCNYMKKDWMLEEFIAHVLRINMFTRHWVIGDTMDSLSTNQGERKPIMVVDPITNQKLMVFPSLCTAARTIKRSPQHLQQFVDKNCVKYGVKWEYTSPRTYNTQNIELEQVKLILLNMI